MYVSLAFQFVSLVSGVGVHQGAGASFVGAKKGASTTSTPQLGNPYLYEVIV
jgi:hypothetical protein